MIQENYVPLNELCIHYQVEMSFFRNLNDVGLIEIQTVEKSPCVHEERISELERIIRIYQELDVNMEGIDVVFNLLHKIDSLNTEVSSLKNRLRLYEE
tara:strand:- start:47 stop:340 length:294 start_codon:yes stop_codon:yes gene_type:complete